MVSVTSTALSCAAALSKRPQWDDALREATKAARETLGGAPAVAMLFISPQHAAAADRIAAETCQLLGTGNLLGCTGEAIAGTGLEIEEEPAVSLWLGRWPG